MKRIIELNPEATERCEPYYCDPFHQMKKESRDNLLKSMQNCTLIIDAVGIPGVSRAISQIGWSSSVPSIHVSVTNGAWSGEIFRQLPNKSTCWQCFQEMFAQPPPGEPTALGYVFGPGCDQPTFTGTTYDLDMVAGLASAVAVDTLRFYKEDSTEYTGDYLLWENRNSDGNLVQKTTIHTVPKRAACPTCQNRT